VSALIGVISVLGALLAESDDPGGDASRRLSWAITGLLVLAGLIVVATVVFWRLTRPERASAVGSMRVVAPMADSTDATGSGDSAGAADVSARPDPAAVSRARRPARGAGADSVAG
jgi:hypothetical protein